MTTRLAVCALALLLVVGGCFCGPQDVGGNGRTEKNGQEAATIKPPQTNRTSRLQKPTQVLNTGFDEIVVESNLQVHNRVGSKNKSKITLPSNSTAAPTNKSARSLMV